MKFSIKKNENLLSLTRRLGYTSVRITDGEFSCLRHLGSNGYPRFHLYIKQEKDDIFFKLHLDHKKPSYEGFSSHGGEYNGKLIEEEKERIIKSLS